jgi:spermidine synthase
VPPWELTVAIDGGDTNLAVGALQRMLVAGDRHPLQIMATLHGHYGRMLRLDGITMATEADEFHYHENIVHVPAIAHASPEDVLIVGGGDGGAAREVLKYRSVRRVDMVEIDAMVVKFAKAYMPGVNAGAFADPRLALHIGNGRSWIETCSRAYDLGILDLSDPVGPAHALYTMEFYTACRARLKPGGIVSLHAESPFTRPRTWHRILKTVEAVFPCVRPHLVFVPSYGTVLALLTASLDVDPARLEKTEVDCRLRERGIDDLRWYGGETHAASFSLPAFLRSRIASEAEPVSMRSARLDVDPELATAATPAGDSAVQSMHVTAREAAHDSAGGS